MRLSPLVTATLAALLAAALPACPTAGAAPRAAFETVRDWAVERRIEGRNVGACLMTRTIRDGAGETAGLVIVSRAEQALELTLADRNWTFARDERLAVPLLLDRAPADPNPIWTGDDQILRTALPETVASSLSLARVLTLRFADGDTDFPISDFAAAYAALKRCDASADSQPSAAAEPALPPQARIASYTVGLAVQRVLQACDVSATGAQRNAVAAKMAALRPEMAPFEAAILAQITKARGFACPTAALEPGFQEAMRRFIALSPDEFAAVIDRQAEAAPSAPVTKP